MIAALGAHGSGISGGVFQNRLNLGGGLRINQLLRAGGDAAVIIRDEIGHLNLRPPIRSESYNTTARLVP